MADLQSRLNADYLKQQLAGTTPPSDPRIAPLPEASPRWPPHFLEMASGGLKPAGVLIPIFERPAGLSVLLTERSAALKLHAGQISFPGGRMEPEDADITITALRETHEEVGITPGLVDVAGYLHPSPTVTGYAITPVVGLIEASATLLLDPSEVESAFEVPLEFLMNSANEIDTTREFGGIAVPITEFHHQERIIWGVTATILLQLRKALINQ